MTNPPILKQINQIIKSAVADNPDLAAPILHTMRAKRGNSLAFHGVDCYQIASFTKLSDQAKLNMAAAIELAWLCILIYDDMLDNDTVRYKTPAAWVKYGKTSAQNSYKYGLQIGVKLHPNTRTYNHIYKSCMSAQHQAQLLPLNASVAALQNAYKGYRFGGLDFGLPFSPTTKTALARIGTHLKLAGQVLNDYKDTCGSRRQAKNYPELREKQLNYPIALYLNSVDKPTAQKFITDLKTAKSTAAYEKLARQLRSNPDIHQQKLSQLSDLIQVDLRKIRSKPLKAWLTDRIDQALTKYTKALKKELAFNQLMN